MFITKSSTNTPELCVVNSKCVLTLTKNRTEILQPHLLPSSYDA